MLRHRLLVTLEVSRGLISCRRPFGMTPLTHWGRVTHICVSKLTIIGSDNGLSPVRRQAIIWTNAGLLLIGPLGRNFSESENLIEILKFSFKKMRLKVSSGKWRPFCLGLNDMTYSQCNGPFRQTCPIRIETADGQHDELIGHVQALYSGDQDTHDDVTKWKHFPRYPLFVRGTNCGAWLSLICTWTNGWAINRDASKEAGQLYFDSSLARRATWYFTIMTSSNVNIFRVTGNLWGESIGRRWIPLTKASDADLWCFLLSAPEQAIGQTIETPVIWDVIALIMTSL